MTVVVENPKIVIHGNNTKTGYSFDFSFTEKSQIEIYMDDVGHPRRKLGISDFNIIPNNPPLVGGAIEFLTVTPTTADTLTIQRTTAVDQKTDFTGSGTVTPTDVENDFDKVIRILQEIEKNIEDLQPTSLPSSALQTYGRIVVTDGANGYTFYPLGFSLPTAADTDKVLVVDFANGRFKFLSQPGLTNPAIPQPVAEYKYIVSSSGTYILSSEHVLPTAGDTGKVETWDGSKWELTSVPGAFNPVIPQASAELKPLVSTGGSYVLGAEQDLPTAPNQVLEWNGTKWVAVDATGLTNPAIPQPTADRQALISTGAGTAQPTWLDYRPVMNDLSSGIVSGLEITVLTDTTIGIAAGWLQTVEYTEEPPTATMVHFAGETPITIDTLTGTSHFLYIEASGASPTLEITTSKDDAPRGTKILICEVEHTQGGVITNVAVDYTVVISIASQIKQLIRTIVGNRTIGVEVTPVSTVSGNQGAVQIQFNAGEFVGYGVSADANKLKPHGTVVFTQSPAEFSWRNIDDGDTVAVTDIDFANLQIEDVNTGALTAVGNGKFVLVPVWIYPAGQTVFQYPHEEYGTIGAIPSISNYLLTIRRSPLAVRNAALVAVLQLKQGSDFSDTANVKVLPVSGVSGSSSGGAGGELPVVSASDFGKVLIVSQAGNWIASAFEIPDPQIGDVGKVLTATGADTYTLQDIPSSLPSVGAGDAKKVLNVDGAGNWQASAYTIPTPLAGDSGKVLTATGADTYTLQDSPEANDEVARTWLSNGVLRGMGFTIDSSKTFINIASGEVLFCHAGDYGRPTDVRIVQFAGSQYYPQNIGTQSVTYVYIDESGTLSEDAARVNWIRGTKALLFRIQHATGTIQNVESEYFVLNAIPEQIHQIFEAYGNVIHDISIEAKAANEFKHDGGTFYGFDAGADTELLAPHKVIIAAADPLKASFVQEDGTFTGQGLWFPHFPDIESPPGTLTPIQSGYVAYFPLWIFPENVAVIQYATESWAAGSEPSAADFLATFKRNTEARKNGALIALVKWEGGKHFTDGNEVLQIGGSLGGGSSTGGLPPATPQDVYRIYAVDGQGHPALGVKLEQPNPDGSDLQDFAGKLLRYNLAGELETFTQLPTPHEDDNIPDDGSFFAIYKDGRLGVLTETTKNTPKYPVSELNLYGVRPFPFRVSNFGFIFSQMVRNDAGGGGLVHFRLKQLFNNITSGNIDTNLPSIAQYGFTNATGYKNPTFRDPFNANIANFFAAGNGEILYQGRVYQYFNTNNILSLLQTAGSYQIRVMGPTYVIPTSLNTTESEFIPFLLDSFNYADTSNTNTIGGKSEDVFLERNIVALKPLNFQGGHIKILMPNELGLNFDSSKGNFTPFAIQFYTSSTDPITTSMVLRINDASTTDFQSFLPKEDFECVVGSPMYHTNASESPATSQPDQNIYFGYIVFKDDDVFYGGKLNVTRYKIEECTFKLTFFKSSSSVPAARYETTTLSLLAQKPAVNDVFWKNTTQPAVTAGDIRITLAFLFLKSPSQFSDFDANIESILPHPADAHLAPQLFLENQTGGTKWTERIECVRRHQNSLSYDIYDVNCTQDQFNNWKLVIYFNSSLSDAALKAVCQKLGLTIWVSNNVAYQ